MGVNTCHTKDKDRIHAYDITKDKPFRCEILGDMTSRKVELAQGLAVNQLRKTIRINGHVDFIDMDDKISLGGDKFIVRAISDGLGNQNQGQYRSDISNFQGYTIIGLE